MRRLNFSLVLVMHCIIFITDISAKKLRFSAKMFCCDNKTNWIDYEDKRFPNNSRQVRNENLYEIRNLYTSGAPKNRMDVVFLGDGYIEKEKAKFFSDINRLVGETLMTVTFNEFLPLLNIWAIFTPSEESGISYPGRPKRTVFKLYRPTEDLRSIYVGRPRTARLICRMAGPFACDYPVIIGNDEYYGGIGGEFAVSTSSKTSGALVLRHELGHNFARVGEEYDGGQAYSGVNSATTTTLRNLKWRHWLTPIDGIPANTTSRLFPREERITYRFLRFPQNDLAKQSTTVVFNSNGRYNGWSLSLTLSGVPEKDGVRFILDGAPLQWKTKGTKDKTIYSWTKSKEGLLRGSHNLTIAANPKYNFNEYNVQSNEVRVRKRIGSLYLYEFGNEKEFRLDNSVISAYPTWDQNFRKTYRPSLNGCLMRNMTYNRLCSVCNEGVWLQFLQRMSLIDDLQIDALKNVTILRVPTLGQLRSRNNLVKGEKLQISWFKNKQIQPTLQDRLSVSTSEGRWEVRVKLTTPKIRKDARRVTEATKRFIVGVR